MLGQEDFIAFMGISVRIIQQQSPEGGTLLPKCTSKLATCMLHAQMAWAQSECTCIRFCLIDVAIWCER